MLATASALLVASYLLGSVPTGLLVGRLCFGIDVRDYGSGRSGAANVLRTLGRGPAALVALVDAAKGLAAVLLGQWLLPPQTLVHALAGLAAVSGHNWPVWAGFRGGRGVLTSLGGLAGLESLAALAAVASGLLVIWRTRYVSLGSLAGASTGALALLALAASGHATAAHLVYALVALASLYALHWDNIARLRQGSERRLGRAGGTGDS